MDGSGIAPLNEHQVVELWVLRQQLPAHRDEIDEGALERVGRWCRTAGSRDRVVGHDRHPAVAQERVVEQIGRGGRLQQDAFQRLLPGRCAARQI